MSVIHCTLIYFIMYNILAGVPGVAWVKIKMVMIPSYIPSLRSYIPPPLFLYVWVSSHSSIFTLLHQSFNHNEQSLLLYREIINIYHIQNHLKCILYWYFQFVKGYSHQTLQGTLFHSICEQ